MYACLKSTCHAPDSQDAAGGGDREALPAHPGQLHGVEHAQHAAARQRGRQWRRVDKRAQRQRQHAAHRRDRRACAHRELARGQREVGLVHAVDLYIVDLVQAHLRSHFGDIDSEGTDERHLFASCQT